MIPLFIALLAEGVSNGILSHMRSLHGTVLLVDGNNVRGAECFGISQQALSLAIKDWSSAAGLATILMLDHGAEQCAWRTGTHAAIAFAGPTQTADDLLVRDSLWLRSERQQPVFMVSSPPTTMRGTDHICQALHQTYSISFIGDERRRSDCPSKAVSLGLLCKHPTTAFCNICSAAPWRSHRHK